MVMPAVGTPLFCACTVNGNGSVAPGAPVWLLPLTSVSVRTIAVTVMVNVVLLGKQKVQVVSAVTVYAPGTVAVIVALLLPPTVVVMPLRTPSPPAGCVMFQRIVLPFGAGTVAPPSRAVIVTGVPAGVETAAGETVDMPLASTVIV